MPELPSAADSFPQGYQVIEVRVGELRQLFNSIDPSPFHERDLDPGAEEFIVEWAKDYSRTAPVGLVVHVASSAGREDEAGALSKAIHDHFARRAARCRRNLKNLLRRGRISLAIGLAFLAASLLAGGWVPRYFPDSHLAAIVRESLVIGGWVAMWGPLEIFLYDWWPIREDARLFDRLSAMPVRLVFTTGAPPDASRSDWPSAPQVLP